MEFYNNYRTTLFFGLLLATAPVQNAWSSTTALATVVQSMSSQEGQESGSSFKKLFCRKGNAGSLASKIVKGLKGLFGKKSNSATSEVAEEKKDPGKFVISIRAFKGSLCGSKVGAALAESVCTGENPGEDRPGEEFVQKSGFSVTGSNCHKKALEALELSESADAEEIEKKAKDTLKELVKKGGDTLLSKICGNIDKMPTQLQFLKAACEGKDETETDNS